VVEEFERLGDILELCCPGHRPLVGAPRQTGLGGECRLRAVKKTRMNSGPRTSATPPGQGKGATLQEGNSPPSVCWPGLRLWLIGRNGF